MSNNMDKPSQDECGEESKKQGKAHWDDEALDAFIKNCVVETIAGNRPGGNFSKQGWKNVIRKFSELTQRTYTQKQLKNKWTGLKKDWQLWTSLVGKETGLGAIDGTHIPVIVPRERQVPYIGRKCITIQNVMDVCDFNMCFTFVWAGWESAAHDARIFMEALRRPILKFLHPPTGKYYIVDVGYPQLKGYLGPYKGERYHLPDFQRGSQPRGKKEIFNHIHSSLRCTIERTFGVWKNRWRMIRQMHNFPMEKQIQIVVASMALHNFIRCHLMTDQEFQPYDDDDELLPSDGAGVTIREEMVEEQNLTQGCEMADERERIANILMSS